MFCHLFSGINLLRVVADTPVLLLYAYFIALATAFGVAVTALYRHQRLPVQRLLAVTAGLFGAWAFADFVVWLTGDGLLHTVGVLLVILLNVLVPLSATYLGLVYLEEGTTLRSYRMIFGLVSAPLILYPSVVFVLTGGVREWCGPGSVLTPYALYFAGVGMVAALYFLGRLVRMYAHDYRARHGEIAAVGTGIIGFFVLFHLVLPAARIASASGWEPAFSLAQYVVIGMSVALGLLALPLTRREMVGGVQYVPHGLLFATLVLLGAQYTLYASVLELAVTSLVFALALTVSYMLTRSINREVVQRIKGEQLARYLANANARLRELDRQKTEFVSVASHQLRSPTAAIVGYASLIDDGSYGDVPDHLKEPLSRILQSGKRIALMVDDFLNVSRIEQGRLNYASDRYDLRDIVTNVFHELQIIGEKKGLACTLDVGDGGPVWVMGDEGKLKQVFSNLLDNAIKYTMEGSVKVSVRVLANHRSAMVTFEDTGIGIDEHAQERLFTKFNRAANANQATVYGTGLGLYVAREIIRAHNGWIHVSSPGINKGSTFMVELPLAEVKAVS